MEFIITDEKQMEIGRLSPTAEMDLDLSYEADKKRE